MNHHAALHSDAIVLESELGCDHVIATNHIQFLMMESIEDAVSSIYGSMFL
jgi:hypothetical protein